MSNETHQGDISEPRINPAAILREEDALAVRYQSDTIMYEEAKKMAFHTIKTKYSQYDY